MQQPTSQVATKNPSFLVKVFPDNRSTVFWGRKAVQLRKRKEYHLNVESFNNQIQH